MSDLENKLESLIQVLGPEEETLRAILEPQIDAEGCELVQINLDHGNLSLFVDKKPSDAGSRITLDELSKLSRYLGDCLDVEDGEKGLFGDRYTLEVSSPGIERALTKVSHFKNSIGKKILVVTNLENNLPRKISGELVSVGFEQIKVQEDQNKEDSSCFEIAWTQVKKAHLVFEYPKKIKK